MKKTILMLTSIFLIYIFIGNVFATSNIIPKDAIRVRIIANSNSDYDQKVKIKVKEKLEKKLYTILKDKESIEEVRNEIVSSLSSIKKDISNIMDKEKYGYKINYGYNYFPKKEFKGITYEEGYYESLVVTLGKGEGDNWWCILFPPLCMIEETDDDVEYTTIAKEIIDKYF